MFTWRSNHSHHNSYIAARFYLLNGLAVYWLYIFHIPWYSNGGAGTDLPLNLLAGGIIGMLMAGAWLLLPIRRISLDRISLVLIIGAVLMSLPLLWSPSTLARATALPRIVTMWGGVLLYMVLRTCRFTGKHGLILVSMLACAGGFQALYVALEIFAPRSWLPEIAQLLLAKYDVSGTGIFGQRNVTASFLAMSLGTMLLLLGLKSTVLIHDKMEIARRGLLIMGILLICAMLVLLSSRTGWLGGTIVVTAIYMLFSIPKNRSFGHMRNFLLILPIAGVIVGVLLMNVTLYQAVIAHEGSNMQRLLTLHNTVLMMREHPFLGYGAGSYEAAYQHFVANLPGGNPGREIMSHPHNELLYQYVEGGISGLLGAVLWIVSWCALFTRCRRIRQKAILICMLPILLHTQLEFPLYYSIPHGIALIMLLACAGHNHAHYFNNKKFYEGAKSSRKIIIQNIFFLVLSLYASFISWRSLQVAQILDRFEASTLDHPERIASLRVSWLITPRWQHDLNLLKLVKFRTEPDSDLLHQFVMNNAIWLSVHADDDMYRNQINVLRYLHDYSEANKLRATAARMFPWEASSFDN